MAPFGGETLSLTKLVSHAQLALYRDVVQEEGPYKNAGVHRLDVLIQSVKRIIQQRGERDPQGINSIAARRSSSHRMTMKPMTVVSRAKITARPNDRLCSRKTTGDHKLLSIVCANHNCIGVPYASPKYLIGESYDGLRLRSRPTARGLY
jgi:hypothetical protein